MVVRIGIRDYTLNRFSTLSPKRQAIVGGTLPLLGGVRIETKAPEGLGFGGFGSPAFFQPHTPSRAQLN